MLTIKEVAVHHTGGIKGDPYYPTQHYTANDVDRIHSDRWWFVSTLKKYGGYNFFIEKNGTWTQFRAIGEETAAQRGRNFDVISICLAGNFTIKPDGQPAESPTLQQQITYKNLLIKLIDKDFKDIAILPNVQVDIKPQGINPHRFYSPTTCYGNYLDNNWGRKFALEYIGEKVRLYQQLIDLYQKLLLAIQKRKFGYVSQSCITDDNRG